MPQIIQVQKARLFLLILISVIGLSGCDGGNGADAALTRTVESVLATAVADQITRLPSATITPQPTETVTPVPSATLTATPVPSATPTINPTTWYQLHESNSVPADLRYGEVLDVPVVLYTSAQAAAEKGERLRTLPGDEVYVSYQVVETIDGSDYAEVEPGGWISLENVTELIPSSFSGIFLDSIPVGGFGWLIEDTVSRSAIPTEEEPGQEVAAYQRYRLFTVLSVAKDEKHKRWFEIEPGEWVSDADFAYVEGVQSNPTRGTTDRWISVNLREQTLLVYENEVPVFATLVSTGKETGWATGEGIFTVFHKDEAHSLLSPDPTVIGNYLIQDAPYILYYQGSWALHGAYWHDRFGIPDSHGCINLSLTDAAWLFNWAEQGEWVILYRN